MRVGTETEDKHGPLISSTESLADAPRVIGAQKVPDNTVSNSHDKTKVVLQYPTNPVRRNGHKNGLSFSDVVDKETLLDRAIKSELQDLVRRKPREGFEWLLEAITLPITRIVLHTLIENLGRPLDAKEISQQISGKVGKSIEETELEVVKGLRQLLVTTKSKSSSPHGLPHPLGDRIILRKDGKITWVRKKPIYCGSVIDRL